MFISIVNEGCNYYFKPRNVCSKKKSDATLNGEVFIFVFWELLVFGSYHAKYQLLAIQKVSWYELLAIPVKQTIIMIATN